MNLKYFHIDFVRLTSILASLGFSRQHGFRHQADIMQQVNVALTQETQNEIGFRPVSARPEPVQRLFDFLIDRIDAHRPVRRHCRAVGRQARIGARTRVGEILAQKRFQHADEILHHIVTVQALYEAEHESALAVSAAAMEPVFQQGDTFRQLTRLAATAARVRGGFGVFAA